MYKIGFIDDDSDLFDDYRIRLSRVNIELLFFAGNCNSKKAVLDWVLNNGVKCILVDYKLKDTFEFNGTELVAFINSMLPDLPCIILTNYCDEGIVENLVIKNLFIEKECLAADRSSPEFGKLIDTLKQAVDVFDNRLQLRKSEYNILKSKKDEKNISMDEEECFVELFKILRAYDEVDDIPAELLTTNTTKQMTDILKSLDRLIEKTE